MTRSSQRKDKNFGRPKFVASNVKCEECSGVTVKKSGITYICTICGLIQERKQKQKRRKV